VATGNVLMYANGIMVWNDTQPGSDQQRPIRKGGLLSIGQTQYSVGGSWNPDESANAIFDEYDSRFHFLLLASVGYIALYDTMLHE
jgi:hypothetical protein